MSKTDLELFPLILLQAKAGGAKTLSQGADALGVSINSPSGEGGGCKIIEERNVKLFVSINSPSGEGGGLRRKEMQLETIMFPLILLQAKAGGISIYNMSNDVSILVSINSPSGEGGGAKLSEQGGFPLSKFPLILLQAKAGGIEDYHVSMSVKELMEVSINSPSGEGGGSYVFKPRHSKAFRPPNRRTPLTKQST